MPRTSATGPSTDEAAPFAGRQVLDIYPLTPGQQGILVESLSAVGDPVYLQHYVFDLDGVGEAATLQAALNLLADELDVLRTGFVWDAAQEPLQVVMADARIPLQAEERITGPLEERIAEILREERQLPFDLGRPPLLRVRAVRRGERAWRLVSTHHHLILDAWSVPLLHARLVQILTRLEAGRPVGERPATGTFHDLVRWQRSIAPDGEESYLRALLTGVKAATKLGDDLPRRVDPAGREDDAPAPVTSVTVLHPISPVDPVSPAEHPLRLARQAGRRPGTLVHAAWALILARWSGTDDVVFGTTVAGRPAELSHVTERIGMFVNTAVMRLPVPGSGSERSLGEWLDDVQRRLDRALEHEHAGLSLAQRSADELPSGQPLLSSVLALQNQTRPGEEKTNEGPVTLRILEHAERTGLPLTLSVAFEDEGISVRVRHDPARVTAGEACWIATTTGQLVADLAVRAPDTRLADISVLPDRTRSFRTVPGAEDIAFGARLTADRLALSPGEQVLAVLAPHDPLTETVEQACAATGCHLDRRDPQAVLDAEDESLANLNAAVIIAPAPLLPALMAAGAPGARMVVAGDPPSPPLVELVLGAGRTAWRLWAGAGSGGADACAPILGPAAALTLGAVPGGEVVDAEGAPVPPGRPGRLRILLPEGPVTTGITARLLDGSVHEFEQLGRGEDEMLAVESLLSDGDVEVVVVEAGSGDRSGAGHAWHAWLAPAATSQRARVGEVDVAAVQARALVLPPQYRPAGYTPVPALPIAADGTLNRAALAAALSGAPLSASPPPASPSPASPSPASPSLVASPTSSPVQDRLARLSAETRDRFLDRVRSLAARDRGAVDRRASLRSWKAALENLEPVGWPIPPAVPGAAGMQEAGTVAAPSLPDDAEACWVAALATAVGLLSNRPEVLIGLLADPSNPANPSDPSDPVDQADPADPGAMAAGAPDAAVLPVRIRVEPGQSFATTRAAAGQALRAARTRLPVSTQDLERMLTGPLPIWLRVGNGSAGAEQVPALAGTVGIAVTASPEGRPMQSEVTGYWNPGGAQSHDARLVRDLAVAVQRHGQSDQDAPLRAADLVPADTADRLVAAGHGGPAAETRAASIPSAVQEQAHRHPHAVAVRSADGEISYAGLLQRATDVARRLQGAGVGEGDRVAVCLPRHAALIWTTLGVMAAGAAYVPLNPEEPEARTQRMLQRSGAQTVLTTGELAGRFPGRSVLVVDPAAVPGPGQSPLPETPGPRSLAYVLFTSGSSGEPKGVMVEHHSVVAFSRHIADAYRIGEGTRLFAFAAATFDVSVFEWWAGLSAGATLVLAGEEERRSAQALQAMLEDERVEVAELPPSLMPLLHPTRLPDLRLVSVGGEAPAGALVDEWATQQREFWNGYGPTEATVAVTLMRCSPPSGGRVPPIGLPMPGHRAYVLDQDLRLVPEGVPGELCIAGPGLARGYLGRPAETAARFVPDPYGDPGARMYRTGDLVRWTGAGVLEFGGRIDDQITVRGFRIEPAEVEAALSTAPGVAQVAVAPRETPDGNRHLVAFVVASDPDQPPTAATLRAWAADRVAAYLVPTRVVLLERLPVTAQGKRDRTRLPELPPDQPGGDRALNTGTDGWTETERLLARDVIGPLLGQQDVGRTDGFFNLGGNSLQVMQIAARVADRFGVQVSLADFFSDPTIARLAALIDHERPSSEKPSETVKQPPEEPGSTDGTLAPMTPGAVLPLSYPQQALYRSYHADGDRPAYHGPISLRVSGDLDLAALRRAFGWLTARHALLRVTVEDSDDGPVQRVQPVSEPRIEIHDVPGDTEQAREQWLRHEIGVEGGRDFDLGTDLPLRVRVHRLAPDDHVVQWTFHHLVIDGWSVGVVARELSEAYTAFRAGKEPVSPSPEGNYGDFVKWHREYVASPAGRSDLEWWRGYLAGAHRAATPLRPAGEPSAFRLGWINLEIPPQTAEAVREMLRSRGMTLYMVCLSVQAILISAETGSEDVLVVTPYSLRVREEWERLVGWFVNRVIVRPRVRPAWTFAELVDAVRETCFAVFAHGRVPFELLRSELGLTGADLPAQLSVQNAPVSGVNLGGVEVADIRDDSGRDFAPLLEVYSPLQSRFQLSVMLRERYDGRMAGGLEYDASVVDEATAARWYAAFLDIVQQGAAQPETTVGDLLRLAHSSVPGPPRG